MQRMMIMAGCLLCMIGIAAADVTLRGEVQTTTPPADTPEALRDAQVCFSRFPKCVTDGKCDFQYIMRAQQYRSESSPYVEVHIGKRPQQIGMRALNVWLVTSNAFGITTTSRTLARIPLDDVGPCLWVDVWHTGIPGQVEIRVFDLGKNYDEIYEHIRTTRKIVGMGRTPSWRNRFMLTMTLPDAKDLGLFQVGGTATSMLPRRIINTGPPLFSCIHPNHSTFTNMHWVTIPCTALGLTSSPYATRAIDNETDLEAKGDPYGR